MNKIYPAPKSGPKVLLLDIETAPIIAYVWGLWDQNVGLNQIKQDWSIISWSAKWLNDQDNKVMYADQRAGMSDKNERRILSTMRNLLDEADVIITQNGKKFDQKKLFARFIINKIQPPSSFRHIDTLVIAKKYFAFTSNKLEHLCNTLGVKYKKLHHKKYPGFEMWAECLKGNRAAWVEMEKYNKYDVLTLQEVYKKLIPWDSSINFNVYHDSLLSQCKCGGEDLNKNGFFYSNTGKYQRYRCNSCGAETRSRENMLDKEKRKSLKVGVVR